MPRPRLLVTASTYPAKPGDGTPGFVADVAAHAANAFDTVVLVPSVPGGARDERVDGVRVVRFRYFPRRWEDLADGAIVENLRARPSRWLQVAPFLIAEALATRRLVRSHRPDVMHIHWLLPQGVIARLVAGGVPQVIHTLGGDIYAFRGRVGTAVKRWVARRATALTTQNADMRDRLVELGADPAVTSVLPLGADVESFAAQVGLVPRRPGRMAFVGRLVEKKGVAVLLEAVRGLPDDLDWSLDIVGSGPLLSALRHAADRCAGRVTLRGALPRVETARAMAGSEVFVLPSVTAASGDQDGLPLVLLEAMAAGCAIVASRLPGIDEVLTDEVNGLLVPPGDVAALRAALARLLGDAPLRARLGQAAAGLAQNYSVAALGDRHIALLRKAAGLAVSPV